MTTLTFGSWVNGLKWAKKMEPRTTIELWMYAEVAEQKGGATLASWVLSKPSTCVQNSMIVRCMLIISLNFVTLKHLSLSVENKRK